MKIFFENLNERFRPAMHDFLKMHKINESNGGIPIKIERSDNGKIMIQRKADEAVFYLTDDYQIFRSLVSLRDMEREGKTDYTEEVYFDTLGAMFDGSQANSIMNVKSAKRMMLYLASMGYNMMMLYTEDCYEIEGEPYFGNMRPRYTKNDFRELDDYAYSLGIELIGAIQTLGHLTEAIKKPAYAGMSDRPDILMVGEEKTYALIEKMIKTVSESFRSRRIHLGLDEAWDLGRGNYLKKHGWRSQDEIMAEHLERVNQIAVKYGLKPMMWADMFFRGKSKTADYFDAEVQFTKEDRTEITENIGIIYWDYYHNDKDFYKDRLNESRKLSDQVIFAGCSRNVMSFGCYIQETIDTTNPALAACKEMGVKEVIATVWGDDQRESSTFATLPGLALFAEHMYNEEPKIESVKRKLTSAVEISAEELWDIECFDTVPGFEESGVRLSRAIVWQDILLGLYDKLMERGNVSEHYANLAERMQAYAENEENKEFKIMFEFYAALARVLSEKQYLGVEICKLYKEGNKDGLRMIADERLPKLTDDIAKLRIAHREYYFDEYKPIGWEILDIRYGGSIMRMDTAAKRINDYLAGKIEKIDELEEERLIFSGLSSYSRFCSASRLSQYF